MRILISGAGIAGPTLAYWLLQYGFEVTIVETARDLRTGGYVIDFWGAAYDIAGRMGVLPEIERRGYMVEEVRVVNRGGKRIAGFPASVFTRATGGRYISIPRSALAEVIYRTIEDGVEVIFGDSIHAIEQAANSVRVSFEHAETREFDLVIGADGLHSRVRQLVFGPETKFEKYLGYKVAAFDVAGYRPRDELVYVMYPQVGQQIARFSMRDDRTMFLFTFADELRDDARTRQIQGQKAVLRERFENSGWECPAILDALDSCDELYFDRVSQVRMEANEGLWSRNRVTLAGDAASCVSLLAGEGSGLAMIASYILAGELHRCGGRYADAFARYQERFGPFILEKQNSAKRFAGIFAPKSRFSLFLNNQVMNLLTIGWVARLAAGRAFLDNIELPEY
ncbi:MAG TPA: FAD-binding domain [Bryobacteraceae bacterium]|nr:FAD-binding domain [Bryobacteraceae bacterium]